MELKRRRKRIDQLFKVRATKRIKKEKPRDTRLYAKRNFKTTTVKRVHFVSATSETIEQYDEYANATSRLP